MCDRRHLNHCVEIEWVPGHSDVEGYGKSERRERERVCQTLEVEATAW